MRWGALRAGAGESAAGALRPGAHPYAVHRPLRRRALRAPPRDSRAWRPTTRFFEEYLHHYVPVLPRGAGRLWRAHFTRSQCAAGATLIAPSEPMRAVLADYGVRTPIHVLPTGLPADRFRAGQRRAFRAAPASRRSRPLLTYVGRVAHEKNIDFLVQVFCRAARRAARRAAGDRRRGTGTRAAPGGRSAALGIECDVALRRLSRARHGAARLLRRRGCLRVRLAHRDPGTGAAGGDGAGHAGGLDGASSARARSCCPAAARRSCPRMAAAVCRRVVLDFIEARLRAARAGARRAYARGWSSARDGAAPGRRSTGDRARGAPACACVAPAHLAAVRPARPATAVRRYRF